MGGPHPSGIRDVASQLSLRAVRTERHGNPTERAHAVPPAYFVAKHVIFFHGHATPRHTVPTILLRTAQSGDAVAPWICHQDTGFENVPWPPCNVGVNWLLANADGRMCR